MILFCSMKANNNSLFRVFFRQCMLSNLVDIGEKEISFRVVIYILKSHKHFFLIQKKEKIDKVIQNIVFASTTVRLPGKHRWFFV